MIKRRLAALLAEAPRVRTFVEDNVALFNGVKGQPSSFDRLDALLGAQAYRLAFWQVAADDINYRRFFDINTLAAIRVEEPAVFEEAHRLILRLVREGHVTGMRIDHPDGLYAPAEYLRQLQRRWPPRVSTPQNPCSAHWSWSAHRLSCGLPWMPGSSDPAP